LRLFQTEAQGAPKRQTTAQQGLNGELNGMGARRNNGQQRRAHGGYR
jgi:hypothetical protein